MRRASEVRFEIEVTDGERRPKRSRPAGQSSGGIRGADGAPAFDSREFLGRSEAARLRAAAGNGLHVRRPADSARSAGRRAGGSQPEGTDLRRGPRGAAAVLASEAGIAIENARLFAEEQKKSRQLTLINNVSSHAITTLDPDEMLARIAAEVENHLPYDHIGIAILDYSTKDLVVQAEAGTRRDAIGRRIPLGEGLVGQVARSGQMATVREVNSSTPRTGSAGLGVLARSAGHLWRAVSRRPLCGIHRDLRISRPGSSAAPHAGRSLRRAPCTTP